MKLPPFDHASKSWDAYKTFHTPVGNGADKPFVQFEDGSLLMRQTNYRGGWGNGCVSLEGRYDALNVALFSGWSYQRHNIPDSVPASFKTPDGERIHDSWLERRKQLRLWDKDTGRVVAADTFDTLRGVPASPDYLGGYVFFPHEGALPVTSGKVMVVRPVKIDKDRRRERSELLRLCMLWARLGDEYRKYEAMNLKEKAAVHDARLYGVSILLIRLGDTDTAAQQFPELTYEQKLAIALRSLPVDKEIVRYDYLVGKS